VARAMLSEKKLANCQVRLGDMYSIPLDNASQDLVIFHQVLHFAEDPDSTLREATRVLKPGGTMLIIDFAPHDMEFLREQHAHRRLGFEEHEIKDIAAEAGLKAKNFENLQGGKLTVSIWHFEKNKMPAKDALKVVQ
jgi:ArsR family transcriptional regulator